MSVGHGLVISRTEGGVKATCSCGWEVPGFNPIPQGKYLDDAVSAWALQHGAREQLSPQDQESDQ